MSEDWGIQLSIKVQGQHLLNLRGHYDDFAETLAWAVKNADQIQLACDSLQGEQPPTAAIVPPGNAIAAVISPAATELGPVKITGFDIKTKKQDGSSFANGAVMTVVNFDDGSKYSTFKALVSDAAKTLWSQGKSVYYTVEVNPKNPKYSNLTGVREARP